MSIRRLVLLLVNDPNKEHSPEQTRSHIIEALLADNRADVPAENHAYDPDPDVRSVGQSDPVPLPLSQAAIPFGQRLQEDGRPVPADGRYKRPRKGATVRRRVAVHKIRSTGARGSTPTGPASDLPTGPASDLTTDPTTSSGVRLESAQDVSPGLNSDSDARAVELLKSLYSIASKWS